MVSRAGGGAGGGNGGGRPVSTDLPAALAIDGGNSKTDVALIAPDGRMVALVRGPGMPIRLGDGTVAVIDELVRSAAAMAGLAAGTVAAHLVACVANVDLPAEERQLQSMLADKGWAQDTLVANDTYAVLRAGLDDIPAAGAPRHWGVGVTCGTGINCVGMAPDGRTAGFLALGMTTGDWGGGAGIGLEAQWNAVRAADGRGPRTALREAVPAHFGLAEPLELAEALHLGTISWDRIAELAPVVLEVADTGDAVAAGIVRRLAEEIFLLVKSTVTRLDLAKSPVPVVLGGGVIASGNSLLIDGTTRLITAEFPAADVRVLLHAPVGGAALLGLDRAGATPAAKQRLRREFATRSPAAAPARV
jgi:N-acetylglucosamine kinase-like BadF-type ATPase